MFDNERIPLAKIAGTRCSRILTYPTRDDSKARERIKELAIIGVTSLVFNGSTLIDGIPVLGKGCVGIVTMAELDGIEVALKIRRDDADRPSMANEARLLRLANSVSVGPTLITATRNFLAMEFLEGQPLFRWSETQKKCGSRPVKKVLASLLHSCHKLDAVGLDHGELSHAPKNVLVNKRGEGRIVDFESASTIRRVANVTSILQYFLFGRISRTIHSSQIFPKKSQVLKALMRYKQELTVESYQSILEMLDVAL